MNKTFFQYFINVNFNLILEQLLTSQKVRLAILIIYWILNVHEYLSHSQTLFQVIATLSVGYGSTLIGYNLAWSSPAISSLQNPDGRVQVPWLKTSQLFLMSTKRILSFKGDGLRGFMDCQPNSFGCFGRRNICRLFTGIHWAKNDHTDHWCPTHLFGSSCSFCVKFGNDLCRKRFGWIFRRRYVSLHCNLCL